MMRIFTAIFGLFLLAACTAYDLTAPQLAERVVLETALGDIEMEVYTKAAPMSSANFLYYVDNGLYNGEGFYRAVRAETDPRGQGMEIIQGGVIDIDEATDYLVHETTDITGLSHINGAVSIARGDPGTGSAAYFFISIGENIALDYGGTRNPDGQGYAVFGQVISGMDVVRAIQAQETKGPSDSEYTIDQILTNPVIIMRARRQ